jgi:hypothetical protein
MIQIKEHKVEDFLELGCSREIAHFATWFYKNLRQLKANYSYNYIDGVYINKLMRKGKIKAELSEADVNMLYQINDAILMIYNR